MPRFFAKGTHVSHRSSPAFQPLWLSLRGIHENGITRRDGKQRIGHRLFIGLLLLVDGDQRMRVERFMREVVIHRNVLTLRWMSLLLFLSLFELHRHSLRGNADFLALDTDHFDCVTQTGDLVLHLGHFGSLSAHDGFEEGRLGVQLDIRQLAHLQQ